MASASGGLGLRDPNDLYVGLLNSRPIADAIIQRFNLVAVYHSKDMTAARKKLAKFTTIEIEKSELISIAVRDRDKKRAAAMANAYAEQMYTVTQSFAVTEASQRRLFFENQIKQASDDLAAAEYSFKNVQQKEGLVQPEAQAQALIANLAGLRGEIAAKQVEVRGLQLLLDREQPQCAIGQEPAHVTSGRTRQA